MANPPGSILHNRFVLKDNSDRSSTYSFGITTLYRDVAFAPVTPSGAALTFLVNSLIAWINATATGATNPLCHYIGKSASRAANQAAVVQYDISNALGSGELAGSPYNVVDFTLGAAAAFQSLPEQVAQTIAWRSIYGTDPEFGTNTRPRASDRNRMYFGPLNTTAIQEDDETPIRVSFTAAFLGDVSLATKALQTALEGYAGGGGDTFQIQVWSRKEAAIKAAADFSQQLYPTTQRRRINKRPALIWTPMA